MTRYEPAGELASRDLVSRAIVREQRRTGAAGLPVDGSTSIPTGRERAFRPSPKRADRVGLDLGVDRIPVGPAAHYVMGGVETDLWGRTTLPGLYAAGEVACTGVHGANRLASNSLLEGLVFGARAAQAMLLPVRDFVPCSALATDRSDRCLAPTDRHRQTGVGRLAERGGRAGLDVELRRAVAGGGAAADGRSRRSTSGMRRWATIAAASRRSSPSAG